jgi:hypothetical protein
VVPGNPLTDISVLGKVSFVMNAAEERSADASYTPIAEPQPVSAGKFPFKCSDVAFAGFSVTCQREQNPHCQTKYSFKDRTHGAFLREKRLRPFR